MRLSATQYLFWLPLLLLAAAGWTAPARAEALTSGNGETSPPPNASAAPFTLDDWQDHLRPPEAPSRSRLYQGDDANAMATHAEPAAPVAITTGHLPPLPAVTKTKTDDDRLVAIAEADRDFFQALDQNPKIWTDDERNRRAQALYDQYTQYIADHPDDVNGVVLYGKFLRRAGEPGLAYEVFRRADQLDPNLAVVKQQLANHFAEARQYAPALDLLHKAETLAPSEPIYHYEIGELLNLFYDQILATKTINTAELDKAMEAEFARAAALAPQEKGFAWRHAECFYDQSNPDWPAALAAWNALASQTTDATELEVIHLHQARALIELGRFDEARPLLAAPVHTGLEASRAALTRRLPATPATPPAPPAVPAPTAAT
jgi:tetratricopeptide (TPR) repeat protein